MILSCVFCGKVRATGVASAKARPRKPGEMNRAKELWMFPYDPDPSQPDTVRLVVCPGCEGKQ